MKKIKLICFDVGGTLVYHTKAAQTFSTRFSSKDFFKKYGLKEGLDIGIIRAEHFDSRIWNNVDKAIQLFMKKIKVTKNKENFLKKFKHFMVDGHKHMIFFKETKPLLKKLRKRGYKIAFITNWHQHARDHFEIVGLSRYADHMLISSEHGKRKPHPSIYKKILKIFKVKPSEALMVGDSYKKDYLAAKKLGMHALWLNRKYKKRKKEIKSLKQIMPYLNKVDK